MSLLAGLFLVAHGLVHLAIWLPGPRADAPFDPHHSRLLGDVRGPARALAIAACALLATAGVLVASAVDGGGGAAVVGAALSLVLVALTFQPWILGAVAIDVAIVAIALT